MPLTFGNFGSSNGPKPQLIHSGGGFGNPPNIDPSGTFQGNRDATGTPLKTGWPGIQLGAGQGPGTQATGQAADNPFNNLFNFQLPAPSSSGTSTMPVSSGSPGVSGYLPLIIVGVIVAGLGYYLFERKKK